MGSISMHTDHITGYIRFGESKEHILVFEYSLETDLEDFHNESYIRRLFQDDPREVVFTEGANIWAS